MLRRNQVFVRAQAPSGKWVSADVMDLDDESFRAFVAYHLFRRGLIAGIRDEMCYEPEITLRTRVEIDNED